MLSDEQRNFCIGVRQDYDVLLRTVLNKSIDSLTRAEISTITNAYINLGQQPFSLTRLAYQYPAIIVLTCLCVLVTAVCIALAIRSQRFRAETEKALRKAEEASVAKTEFLSNMSHDIRTPINGIMGMLDIAEDNFDNKARVRDCMTKMRGAASHLLSLINDVLDMSRIESGKIHLEEVEVNLSDVLHDLKTIVSGQIYAKTAGTLHGCHGRDRRRRLLRQDPAESDLAEPAVQRHQVYPGGRHGLGTGAAACR